MAEISCSGSYNGTYNTVKLEVWRESNTSTRIHFKITSSYSTSQGSYKRIYIKIGSYTYDSGYCSNFYAFPCKNNSTLSDTDESVQAVINISETENVYIYLGCGFGHDRTTDGTAEGYLYTAIGTPTINTPSVSSIGRTSANSSFSVADNGGAGIVDNYIDAATSNFSGVVSTITSTSGTFYNLTPNKTYYVRANSSNGYYRGYSSVTSFHTTHNNPTIGSRSVSTTRASSSLGSTYTASVSYATSYDYANFGSHKLEYGTSTSYGSTASSTGTGGSSSFNLGSLQPNKTYYYRITETDDTGQYSQTTGSFSTPSIAPTISTSASAIVDGFKVKSSASVDTNVSLSGLVCSYGTSTSYGTNVNLTNGTESTITGLTHNTVYYYRVIATDSTGKTATSTGSLRTTGNAPSIGSLTNVKILAKEATASCVITPDTNDSVSSATLVLTQVGSSTSTNFTGTASGSTYTFNITGLTPAKEYSWYVKAVTTYSNATSGSITFKTLGNGKINGYYLTGGRLNGKTVTGIKLNGVEII